MASGTIESATAQVGDGAGTAARDLAALATGLPTYTQEIGNADADNRLALPLGAAYLREASGLMRDTLLKKAKDLYAAENANLGGTSAQATGLPLIWSPLVAGLAVGYLLYRAVTLAARAHQPGAQRRPGRGGRPPRRLGGLAGRRLPGGQGRPA